MANFNYLAINDTTELGFINERLAVNVKAIAASYKMDSLAAWTQAKALADIDYKGYITLESDNILADIPTELYPSMLRYMHDAARHLANMVESYKK